MENKKEETKTLKKKHKVIKPQFVTKATFDSLNAEIDAVATSVRDGLRSATLFEEGAEQGLIEVKEGSIKELRDNVERMKTILSSLRTLRNSVRTALVAFGEEDPRAKTEDKKADAGKATDAKPKTDAPTGPSGSVPSPANSSEKPNPAPSPKPNAPTSNGSNQGRDPAAATQAAANQDAANEAASAAK